LTFNKHPEWKVDFDVIKITQKEKKDQILFNFY